MKFRILLYLMYWRLWWLSQYNRDFQRKIADRKLVVTFGAVQHQVYRHFVLNHGKVSSGSGKPERSDLVLEFKSPAYGYYMLTQKATKPMAFAKGMNQNDIVLKGEMQHVFWLMGVARYLPVRRQGARASQFRSRYFKTG